MGGCDGAGGGGSARTLGAARGGGKANARDATGVVREKERVRASVCI